MGIGRSQVGNRVLPPGNRIPPGAGIRTAQVWTDKHGHKHFRRRFVAFGVGFVDIDGWGQNPVAHGKQGRGHPGRAGRSSGRASGRR